MTESSTSASRRALLGLGGVAALSALASQASAASAAPLAAAPASAPAPASASRPPASPRAVAFRPMLGGGPSTADESAALGMPAAAAAEVPVGKQYTTFRAAALAARRTPTPLFDAGTAKSHLLRRATFGPRAKDVADLKKLGIDGWLERQLNPTKIAQTDAAAWTSFPLAFGSSAKILANSKDYSWDGMLQTCYAALGLQVFSNRQLFEITVDIFANHLHVPMPGEQWATGPDYLKNVIRKHAFGKYSSMLRAAMKHPAMLSYLNNDESRKAHVNENLGRELLELHTVGIAGGYTEDDVKNSARILSGRSWEGWLERYRSTYGQYRYKANDHYVGAVKVLGFTHENASASGGEAVGDAYLDYLARHPATAQKIARKIAVRFVSDSPSSDLVNRLAAVYLKHDTDIRQVVRAVFLSSDFWSATGMRMRRPLEDAVGAARVLGVTRGTDVKKALSHLYWSLNESGQTPYGWMPPNGYPDVAAAWLGAGAMISRWNVHRNFIWWGYAFGRTEAHKLVTQTTTMTADAWLRAISTKLLGVPMSEAHRRAVLAGADLRPGDVMRSHWWKSGRAVALVLDSPYFQLR
ncbi:DUF1800 domain-containing protein [Homoserinibacter sp. YIM 151385]|uniref:DUF1800 domain-containing protein n=1 Tax=Homoserinibacter sp. YIM 151385 TaxID=2985506 RepID=UPI0022F130D9|nr:DUF1800 domain-containing protein [Homoserinibacter sp. YIM 151385]WBU38841.1 DUF1800 domain-containing protein [Homoserinibacter sp. YIM 151385]